jgi:hypothetical protein
MDFLFDRAALISELEQIEREIAALHAQQLRVLARLQALDGDPKRFVREEVATALRWSEAVTRQRMHVAHEVVTALPEIHDALREGRISLAHADSFCELTSHFDEETAALVAENVLEYAETHDVASFRRKVKRERAKADPIALHSAYEDALSDRRVWSTPDSPGMASFGAVLPAAGAAELMHALSFMASQAGEDDKRTKPQRMADALLQLGREVLAGTCSHCDLPPRPPGPAINVTVALSTLAAIDDQHAELNGDVIPASLAGQLAASSDATWRRIVTDDLGELIDYGRTTYRPPVALHDHVVARDRTCRFPDCHRRAERCDVDHVLAWEHSGTTSADNLIALCARHHRLKHEGGWQVKLSADGRVHWTSPVGHTYVVEPSTYPVDGTAIVSSTDNDGLAAA